MSSTSSAPAASSADLPTDLPADSSVDSSADLPVDTAADTAADADAGAPAQTPEASQQQASPAATASKLAELFPALFRGQPKPLKLRIQVDIQERAPGVFSKQALSAFFRRHTGATSYLIAVSKGTQRFDLDGQPAGELSDEHRQVAADELARRRANANAKRELEEAGRRQRAGVLRDFETTKLTTANFCALKGIAPEQLDAVLAQARAEALEDAQRPRRPEHGHGQPRRDGAGRRDAGRNAGEGPGRGPRPGGNGGPRNEARNGPNGGPNGGPNNRSNNGPRTEGGEARREGRPPRRG